MNRMLQRCIVLGNLIVLPLALPLFSLKDCWRCDIGKWLDIPAQVAPADAIVVLGGAVNERLPVAVSLWQAGLAPELWYTGATASGQQGDGSGAQTAFKLAQEMGIPADVISLLTTSNTWEDGEQIAATVRGRGIDKIVVVTSWYHSRRALCSIHYHLRDDSVQVYYQPAETPGYGPDDWWLSEAGSRTVTTELYKIIFYWGYYGLVPWTC